ncbi:MAG: hypothetical protein VX938_13060 [Myxococcota bacterium]|nr:hypothetical protein [Myxococcota bacterium]MEE2779942.1 hypothetical protein [Myxococcota bacterium]
MSLGRSRVSASFDVLVIGGENLTGLLYAALAAREGHRVGVICQGSLPNTYRHEGHTFVRQPERLYGLSTSPLVARVFNELSLGIEIRNLPVSADPLVQIVFPDRRLAVSQNPNRWLAELERELPESVRVMQAFEAWSTRWMEASNGLFLSDVAVPTTGLRAKQSYKKLIEGCEHLVESVPPDGIPPLEVERDSSVALALVEGVVSQLVECRSRPMPPLVLARLWNLIRSGSARVPGGIDGLRMMLLTKLRDQCGIYRDDAYVSELVIKRGRAVEVILADRSERLGCDLLVCNTDPRQLLQMIPSSQRVQSFQSEILSRRPLGWRLTMNVAVDPKVIPVGMGAEVTLLAHNRTAGSSESPLWISRPGATDESPVEGRPGPGVLVLSGMVQGRGATPTLADIERTAHGMLSRLRTVVPWLDDHLQLVHVPCLVQDPSTGRSEVDMRLLTPIFDRTIPLTMGLGTLNPTTPYKNVLLAGDQLFAGMGLEGPFVGALQTLLRTRKSLPSRTQGTRML